MTKTQFIEAVHQFIVPGVTMENSGGGTPRICTVTDERLSYMRGRVESRVLLTDLFRAYDHYKGRRVSSVELQQFAPAVFDSKGRPAGHSCNCTFLFLLLHRMGLAGAPAGKGVRGDPFAVEIR